MLALPSYRNQSIYLHSKSIDWFLYMATVALNGLKKHQNLILRIIHVWHCVVQYGFMRVWTFYLFFWKISFSWMQSDSNSLHLVRKQTLNSLAGWMWVWLSLQSQRQISRLFWARGHSKRTSPQKWQFLDPFPHIIISHYFRVPISPMSPSK